METYTIAELTARSGRSKKAIRNLCDRGVLPFVVRNGLRRIPESAAYQAGLLTSDVSIEAAGEAVMRSRQPQPASDADAVTELIEKLAALAEENGRLKALTQHSAVREAQEHAEVDRLQNEVIRLRAEVETLRAQPSQPPRPSWRWGRPRLWARTAG